MSSRKRSRQDQETLQLKLADCCLTVDAGTVRSASELAGGLPAGATEWDLSGLILDGQPVERDTVVQWLNCAYDVFGSVQDEDCFDADTHFDSSAASLYKLLAFTDAVLSRRGVFTACMQGLEELFVAATLCGEEMQVCMAAGVHTCKKLLGERRQLKVVGTTYPSEAVGPACSVEEWDVFVREVCVQTEALLFIAHKLRLQPLIKVMHTFLFTSCLGGRGLLYGKLQLVLTDRVLEAGMGSSSLTKAQWVNSILTRPCGLVRDVFGQRALLHPVESSIRFEQDTKTLHFEAELEDDLAGGDRGAKVGVRVELFDDQRPRILVGKAAFPAQLCFRQGRALLTTPICRMSCAADGWPVLSQSVSWLILLAWAVLLVQMVPSVAVC